MTTLIDPRPLEPSWVFDNVSDDPGQLEWQISYIEWSPSLRRNNKIKESGSDMVDLFQRLETIIRSGKESQIDIDASSLAELEEIPPLSEWVFFHSKVPHYSSLLYRITINEEGNYDCQDNNEAMMIIECAIYNRATINVEIGY
jgi:hypothetical protein